MKLTAIYARVSTARQEEEQTIKTQLSAVNELVQKSNFRVVEEYIDEGWSGDILARPALDKLRQDAKAKLWDTIVVYDPDRIARRYSYQELVMDELREAGIEVVFVTISTLLRHKAYIGEAHWGSSYAVVPEKPTSKEKYRKIKKSSRRTKPESEWLTIPVPAIVDKAVFARVQDKIKANKLHSQKNTVNEYLLTGRIYCVCGRRRAGEGPKRGKHLYYRCVDRVLTSPLPRTCMASSVNARIADRLVWDGVTGLMTSPKLMQNEIRHWRESQDKQIDSSVVDVLFLKKEISKFKAQFDRYNQAYGSGVFTIEQLKEYIVPIREKIALYESQIVKSEQAERELQATPLPDEKEVAIFAKEASRAIKGLDFKAKKAVISNVVDRVVGTKEKLQVYGFIPVTSETNVNVFTNDRHRRLTKRRKIHALQRSHQKECSCC